MDSKLKDGLIELAMGNQSDRKALARLEKAGNFSVDEMVEELDRLENSDAIARDVCRSTRKFSPLRMAATIIGASCSVATIALIFRPCRH